MAAEVGPGEMKESQRKSAAAEAKVYMSTAKPA
jgi:hypothetical protein